MPTSANDDNVRELLLFIENDGDLYRQQFMPIMKNLARKMLKDTYDPKLAVKAWRYLADAGAKKYVKEFGTEGDYIFSPADRQAVAQELAEAFDRSVANGEWDLKDLAKREAGEAREDAEGKILYQNGDFFVLSAGKKGFEVYRNGDVHATRVASIGPGPRHGLPRAIAEADKWARGERGPGGAWAKKSAREGGKRINYEIYSRGRLVDTFTRSGTTVAKVRREYKGLPGLKVVASTFGVLQEKRRRCYTVVVVNDKTGEQTDMLGESVSHAEAVTIKRKLIPDRERPKHLRSAIVEVGC